MRISTESLAGSLLFEELNKTKRITLNALNLTILLAEIGVYLSLSLPTGQALKI